MLTDKTFLFNSHAPFRLGSESPDVVSMEFKEGILRSDQKSDSERANIGLSLNTNRASSSTCLSDTNLGILSFKSSVETTAPSFMKGIGTWNRNNHPLPESSDDRRQNSLKPTSVSIHQQQYNLPQISATLHHSHTDIIPPFYHPQQHNEFIQSDMQSLSTNPTVQNASSLSPSTRDSQNYSTSNPHMYL